MFYEWSFLNIMFLKLILYELEICVMHRDDFSLFFVCVDQSYCFHIHGDYHCCNTVLLHFNCFQFI